MRSTTVCLLFMISSVLSCNNSSGVWEDQQGVVDCRWPSTETLTYRMEVDDTVSFFNLLIDLRNRTDYPFSNLYLFVSAQAPNGAVYTDTMNYILAKDNGEWTGKGMMSKFKDNRFPFRTNIRFPVKGEYLLKVRHGMRRDTLPGIANVGMRLEYATVNEERK